MRSKIPAPMSNRTLSSGPIDGGKRMKSTSRSAANRMCTNCKAFAGAAEFATKGSPAEAGPKGGMKPNGKTLIRVNVER